MGCASPSASGPRESAAPAAVLPRPGNVRVHQAQIGSCGRSHRERLPHGFTELFKDDELDQILNQRQEDYQAVKLRCEDAASAEEAFTILKSYSDTETKKRLPYAERYLFDLHASEEIDIVFLSFYIFLRGRELVAIKRWFGESGYTLSDAADETVEQVFGAMNIDILD